MKIKLYEFLEKKIETINYEKILSTFITDKLKLKLSKDSKSYRTKISDGNEEENKRILSSIFPKASTKIYVTKAKENEKSKSSKYDTYVIDFSKDTKLTPELIIPKDTRFFLVNTHLVRDSIGSGIVNEKMLVPNKLLNKTSYSSSTSLILDCKKNIESLVKFDELKEVLTSLLTFINIKGKSSKSKLKEFSDEVKFNSSIEDSLSKLSSKDLAIIAKDFGEILSSIYLSNKFDLTTIGFPKSANEKMVDFYLNDIKFSAKYNQGAAASVGSVLDNTKSIKGYEDIVKLLEIIRDNNSVVGTFKVAEYLKIPIYKNLKKLIPSISESNFIEKIKDFMGKKWNELNDIDKITKFFNDKLYDIAKPSQRGIETIFLNKNQDTLGLIISPMSYDLARFINSDKNLIGKFNELVNKIAIHQIYITKFNSKGINFKMGSFKNMSFKFEGVGSVIDYKMKKMGFKGHTS